MIRRMIAEGHHVADHTCKPASLLYEIVPLPFLDFLHAMMMTGSHPSMNSFTSRDPIRTELRRSNDEMKRVTQTSFIEYRPPYGELNALVRSVMEEEGYKVVVW
jgi:peptidoglycan/xylan/chitin deacetylase (PgdA/CDA1 family)